MQLIFFNTKTKAVLRYDTIAESRDKLDLSVDEFKRMYTEKVSIRDWKIISENDLSKIKADALNKLPIKNDITIQLEKVNIPKPEPVYSTKVEPKIEPKVIIEEKKSDPINIPMSSKDQLKKAIDPLFNKMNSTWTYVKPVSEIPSEKDLKTQILDEIKSKLTAGDYLLFKRVIKELPDNIIFNLNNDILLRKYVKDFLTPSIYKEEYIDRFVSDFVVYLNRKEGAYLTYALRKILDLL